MMDRSPKRRPTAFVARTAVAFPGEARPALEPIRKAAVPALVASGDHAPGIERICDALAVALDAQRLVAPGAGHFVAAAPGFAERFERFLRANQDPG